MQELLSSPHPEGRDNEQTETLRKRLVYESRKRGILEMDLILGTFAKSRLAELDDAQLREYDRVRFSSPFSLCHSLTDDGIRIQFLTLPDWSIFYYVTGKAPAPEPWKSSWILSELLAHAENRGRTVRRMPDLEERK